MSITINDILKIDKMSDAIIVAGEGAIDKKVKRVATIEKPWVDHLKYSNEVAMKGDLYLSKLYVFKDNSEKLHREIKFIHSTGGSGLITHQDSLNLIDDITIDLMNEYDIPLIAINDSYGLAELTYNIMDLIIHDKLIGANETILYRMITGHMKKENVKTSLLQVQPKLNEYILAFFISSENKINFKISPVASDDIISPICNGMIYITSFREMNDKDIKQRTEKIMKRIKSTQTDFSIGTSLVKKNLIHGKEAILEAIYAGTYANLSGKNYCSYEDLGLFDLLLHVRDQKILKAYKKRIFKPIEDHEGENYLEMMHVLTLFVKYNGDYKLLADKLYIHETTVRYRVNKAKNILGYENTNDFFADMKIAVYCDWILENAVLKTLVEDVE